MSGSHDDGKSSNLSLYAFRIVPASFIKQNQALIKRIMFNGIGDMEINSISGYLSYVNSKKLYRTEDRKLALPQSKEDATKAAVNYLSERYSDLTSNKNLQQFLKNQLKKEERLAYDFSVVPPPNWLRPIGTFLVRNDKRDQPDHWLCKFQVEIQMPNGTKMPVLGSSIDVRIGESINRQQIEPTFEVIGFQSHWRPIYNIYKVEQFLVDTGDPEDHDIGHHSEEEEHAHLDEFSQISYILSDENVPQSNLLPYEATISGEHHINVLPASKESLWVEFRVNKEGGKYKITALVMGGSGNYNSFWGYWNPFDCYEIPYETTSGEGQESEILP